MPSDFQFDHQLERLRSFFPGVVFNIASISDHRQQLSRAEFDVVQSSTAKRQKEYATGRLLAHDAMATLDRDHPSLLSGDNRQPLWPHGLVGSIAHSQTLAAVALAYEFNYLSIGIDIEAKQRVDGTLVDKLLTPAEQDRYQHLDPTLIFCAKEATYKMLYPLIEKYVDFLEVEIHLDLDKDEFHVTSLSTNCPEELVSRATGRIISADTNWLTCLAIK